MCQRVKTFPGVNFSIYSSTGSDVLIWRFDSTDPISVQCDKDCTDFVKKNSSWMGLQLKKDEQKQWQKDHHMSKNDPIVWINGGKKKDLTKNPDLSKLRNKYFYVPPGAAGKSEGASSQAASDKRKAFGESSTKGKK